MCSYPIISMSTLLPKKTDYFPFNYGIMACRKNGSTWYLTDLCKHMGLGKVVKHMVKSHEMDSLLKFIFSNPNGRLTYYSMYP